MAVHGNKDELLIAIEKSFAALNKDLDRVPIEFARTPVLESHVKGSRMTPADLVAYLIGWNQQVLAWHARRAEGLPDELPAPGIKWNELDRLLSVTTANMRLIHGRACALNSATRRNRSSP